MLRIATRAAIAIRCASLYKRRKKRVGCPVPALTSRLSRSTASAKPGIGGRRYVAYTYVAYLLSQPAFSGYA